MRETTCDVLVVGAGVGGCAAALAAAEGGASVVLSEEFAWIGGQLTSQAVPPDENPWIETYGASSSYKTLRNRVRDYYRRNYPLMPVPARESELNPGGGWVSKLCAEPRVFLEALHSMLAPHLASGRIQLLQQHRPVWVDADEGRILSVELACVQTAQFVKVHAQQVIDATETGELLPLSNTAYVIGAEARSETGEPHAADVADPRNQQAVTWCFAAGYDPDGDHVIEKPLQYESWRRFKPDFWPGPLIGWDDLNPVTLQPRRLGLMPGDGDVSMFEYRKIVDHAKYELGTIGESVTLVNWPLNDMFLRPVVDVEEEESVRGLEEARQLSLCLLYWLQTEAPRADGKHGYPGLRLRPELMGTADGLAMAPYIRESRRIKAQYTVVEQDLSPDCRPGEKLAERYPDSVGIGYYRIDLHPSTGGDNYIDVASLPFQIPLRSLVPIETRNLLAGCKNLGVTHITNGCYRLHPVEWAIGEAAGTFAAQCVRLGEDPWAVCQDPDRVDLLQRTLEARGVPLAWPES